MHRVGYQANCGDPIISGMNSRGASELVGEGIAFELVPVTEIKGDDELDTTLLREMFEDAKRYISAFSWCGTVLDCYFGGGIGGIFAVFFFRIHPSDPDVDSWIWVMVGDIPSAYLPLSDCNSPTEAFRTYIHGMTKWVELARKGQRGTTEQGVPPVNVPATPEWAERLNKKLYGLILTIKPIFEGGKDGGFLN